MTLSNTSGYSGKVLLVTGGAMGIGAGIVEVLAEAGASVVIADVDGAKAQLQAILPGGVATPGAIGAKGPVPEGPGRRAPPLGMCEPRDIGAAVMFLASPMARSITNQTLAVDGGWSVT